MNSLRFVRNFVENCAQSLRPLSMLLTDSLLVLEDASVGWQRKTEIHNFRMIAWGEVADLTAEESEELINETCKGLVGEKYRIIRVYLPGFNWFPISITIGIGRVLYLIIRIVL